MYSIVQKSKKTSFMLGNLRTDYVHVGIAVKRSYKDSLYVIIVHVLYIWGLWVHWVYFKVGLNDAFGVSVFFLPVDFSYCFSSALNPGLYV